MRFRHSSAYPFSYPSTKILTMIRYLSTRILPSLGSYRILRLMITHRGEVDRSSATNATTFNLRSRVHEQFRVCQVAGGYFCLLPERPQRLNAAA
jgi:hypothetical protein